MCIVVTGNPFDGLNLFGPFGNHELALSWAENNLDEWLIVDLINPAAPYFNERKENGSKES